jgi:hypothetical protein
MSFCSLDVYGVFKELKTSVYCESIQVIDISGNKPDKLGIQALAAYIEDSPCNNY